MSRDRGRVESEARSNSLPRTQSRTIRGRPPHPTSEDSTGHPTPWPSTLPLHSPAASPLGAVRTSSRRRLGRKGRGTSISYTYGSSGPTGSMTSATLTRPDPAPAACTRNPRAPPHPLPSTAPPAATPRRRPSRAAAEGTS